MHGLFGGPWALGALGPGPAGPLDKTALAAPKAWNRLPTKLKTSTCSTDSFKRSLKTFSFQSAYGCETRVS